MGDRGATGGAWGARDEASWWPGGAGEIQNQQQVNEEVARSTPANTQQLYTYKMSGGFSNDSGDNSTPSYGGYRALSNSNTREESPQQQWWYGSGSVDSQQQNSSPTQLSPDPEQGSQSNGSQQNHIQQLQHQAQQEVLQQALQQNQQQSLQQMLQQQQQSQQSQTLQQSIQQTLQVSQAQAQALVQAQQALQQQVAQSLQQQQQTLNDHIQAVQQQQIQAALQRQTATLQELQQQAQQQALIAQSTTTHRGGRMPRAKIPNKPRGRMTAYAFFVQTCREEHKRKHPDENVVFAAFSKKCAERWNTMSEKEKARFHEMAEVDKKRYDLEMQTYVPPKDAVKVGRGRKRHTVKDPNAPKRSLSAFFWFCNDERSKVKAVNPEYTMGDIAKELGRRWAATEPEAKGKYEQLSEQDKARYDREMSAYKSGVQLNLAAQSQPEETADFEEEEYN